MTPSSSLASRTHSEEHLLNYHREPRSTLDIDINIFLSPGSSETALGVLQDLYGLPMAEQVQARIDRDGQARTLWRATYVDLSLPTPTFTSR